MDAGEEQATGSVSTLDSWMHKTRHRALAASTAIGYRTWQTLLNPSKRPLDAKTVAVLASRFDELVERDLQNVETGYYSKRLLDGFPLSSYLSVLPKVLIEMPRVAIRRLRNRYDELPEDVELERYPAYYRRTFHWQSDGWLSSRSAELYDAGVEFLFGGTADMMRRMAIPPLVDAVADTELPRILDVGCGTGRFLLQLADALPEAKLYGLDLSPFYVGKARRVVADTDNVAIVNEPAEDLPFADRSFDAVASIFLFHELPKKVRRTVAKEMLRVLKPGGAVVICDSAQLADSKDIAPALYSFPESYHEPYYRSYLRDDLCEVLGDAGFEMREVAPWLVSKVVVAARPG